MSDVASTNTNDTRATNGDGRPDKVVQMRQAVTEKAGAVSDWAQEKAKTLATTAKEKPLAAAGMSAGAAFALGLLAGLLLARATAPEPEPDWKERLMRFKPDW